MNISVNMSRVFEYTSNHVCVMDAVVGANGQESSSTWCGSMVWTRTFPLALGLSLPFMKKVSSSPFPLTKMGPLRTKRKPYSFRII